MDTSAMNVSVDSTDNKLTSIGTFKDTTVSDTNMSSTPCDDNTQTGNAQDVDTQNTSTMSVETSTNTIAASVSKNVSTNSTANVLQTQSTDVGGASSVPTSTGTTTASSSSTIIRTFITPSGRGKPKMLLRDENAPKAPLSSYLRFLNEHRENVRLKNPNMPFHDVTKILGAMWSALPPDKKQIYFDQYERDKNLYKIELDLYKKSDCYKTFMAERDRTIKVLKEEEKSSPGGRLICIPCNQWFENPHNFNEHVKGRKHRNTLEAQARSKKSKTSLGPTNEEVAISGRKRPLTQAAQATSNLSSEANNFPDMSGIAEGDLNVPVFSDAFLNYNKSRESELRKLRKATTEFEEQNAILSKHIDSLKSAVGKLQEEKTNSEEGIRSLEPFLKKFCKNLVRTFSDVRLPNTDVGPTESDVEDFLVELSKSCKKSPDSEMAKEVKNVLNGFDYPSCLSK